KYNQTIPMFSFNYNQDDGLYLGFSLKFIRHGFRKVPYKSMHEFNIVHALATNAFNFRYYAEYISVFGKTGDLLTDINIKAPNNTTNFFGYGDQSIYNKSKPGKFKYYRARYNLGDISLLIRKRFSDKVMIAFGPTYEFYKLDSTDNIGKNIVTTIPGVNKTTLFTNQSYFGGKFSFVVDTRDDKVVPQKGINWQTSYRYLSGLNDQSNSFSQLNSEFSFYLKLIHNKLVFANRVGGGATFGDNFEFYQAQYLGGDEHLRGFRKYRFAGKSKIFNDAELRLRLANFRTYLFPAAFGILAFYDTGKIYDKDDNSSKWLSGYGGGIWVSPLKRMVLTVTYTASKEDKLPLIGLGWKF
ncbi:MAG TPA: BamA/TamA family outer membrane protein, partial [Chitinophagaceae bacterium]|nr:BamA/TamA family outer membrane protein [Chitinophagaceae bacterium]